MRAFIAVVMVLATSIASAAWIQVGTGTGPAKVSVDKSSSLGATVTIEIPGIQTESVAVNGAVYTKLSIPGAVSANLDVGKPDVPAVPVLLARPTGSAVTLSILSIQTETLRLARVFPMQPPLKIGEQAGPLVVDASFYTSDVEYPSARLSSPSLATWRDLDVVNVHVYPVVVRPAQREVIVASRITFRVDFSGGSYPRTVASWMPPLYARLIQNYDALNLTTAAQEPPGTKCLVFCDDSLATQDLDSLLRLMTKLGDSTEVIHVPTDVPADTAEIKSRIINQYYDLAHYKVLRWVFFVGDYIQIPPHTDSIYTAYSDYWYSDLTKGHVDSCDKYPEVGIARLSPDPDGADDSADLSHQIAKIETYMMGRDTDDTVDWLNKITLVGAYSEDTGYHFEAVVRSVAQEPMHFWSGTIDTLFGSVDNNASLRDSINAGTGVLTYLGHGDPDRWSGWYSDSSWTTVNVASLSNQHTPVVFNIACDCGDPTGAWGPCLSQKWMSKYDSGMGAVASFAAYAGVHKVPDYDQCSLAVRAIADYYTVQGGGHEYVAPVFDLGGIQMLMDADIAKKWPVDSDDDYYSTNIYYFYWLGNPAMQVWSGGTPKTATVTYPPWITKGQNSFTVTVTIGDEHVEEAQVCAYKPNDFYVVGSTDQNGIANLTLTASTSGTFYVSASKGHANLRTPGPGVDHTPMLPYFGTAVVSASPPSPNMGMTEPNWSRKTYCGPYASDQKVVYTGNDTVFYTQSTDYGTTWSDPEPIGQGTSPAIAPDWECSPWVAYLTDDGDIIRAIRSAGSPPSWDKATVFDHALANGTAGAPSLAWGIYGEREHCGYVTYPVHVGSNYYVLFNRFNPSLVYQPETLDAAGAVPCYGASIAMSGFNMWHVAWIRRDSVIYRQRAVLGWSPQIPISSPVPNPYITEPASNPSVEAYGDSVFCVWRGPYSQSNQTGEIWRRSRCVNWIDLTRWADPWNQSGSPNVESDFPEMTTSFATAWKEQASGGNTDIWGRFLPDLAASPFFETPLQSLYPHAAGYWAGDTFKCNTVWTEQLSLNPLLYAVLNDEHDWTSSMLGKGLGPGPHGNYEPASYYAAELGLPEPSPYCLSRGGFARFENWAADTSATGLTYQLPYLDPRRAYKLRAVLYHEGDSTWSANLRCDSGPWHHVRVPPSAPDTFSLQVPKASYKNDARIIIELTRVTGGYVSLARLKLFQIEEHTGDDGGVQSQGSGWTYATRLRGCSPNPFARWTSVNYELAQYGPVQLSIHDASGRLVKRLEYGPRQMGIHVTRWNGTDDLGRAVPAGVFFVRLSAGGNASTGRLTLVR